MSRSQQDQFIDDDEEETCPLCVEEFDLTDKGFRPCPCGYQICQFCYHNVKTNMNGLCPACRRPYNDADIEYKVITPEETAAHKARQAHKQKKTLQALQKEKQKAEADNLSRKHLAGMRVVQKNLVYVTGLSPTSQEDQLLQTLRGDQYFGQYGKIIKIVVSKAKDPSHPHSVGVYVTYEHKEDAASCITAVDGSKNGDRTLRAQFGTTKYCSAYLRGENCTNRNCMFLHEPGEANESYSRADLSALNAGSSQSGSGRPPPPQSQQPVASAAPPMMRQGSSDQHPSSPALDRPALPSTASWASRLPQSSRAESRSTSGTQESPAPVMSTPAATQPEVAIEQEPSPPPIPEEVAEEVAPASPPVPALSPQPRRPQFSPIHALLKGIKLEDFRLVWSPSCLTENEQNMIKNFPPLFDENGGAKRRLRRQREEESRRIEQDVQAFQQPPPVESDDNPEMSGSLQLGGEPEERQGSGPLHQSAIHPPGPEGVDPRFQYAGATTSSPGASERGLTAQQHQQMLLQTLKPATGNAGFMNNPAQQTTFNPSTFPPQQQQQQQQQQSNNAAPLGHQRNVSRYSFANDTSSASSAVKPVANSKLMNQQSAMMPPPGGNHFATQHQQPHGQFYTSNVQGPPPGLKTTGTPPVSGNLTFGQGHGFATGGLQYGAGANRNQQDNYYRDLMRGNDGTAGGREPKRELQSLPNYNTTQSHAAFMASQPNAYPAPPYANLGAFGDGDKQRKKKGKKHRHANTSSSSGGGMIDVSDPGASHLLSSRMHQGAGGFSGGAFAGQAVGAAGGLYSGMHGGGGGGGYNGRW
ncbi:Putative RNA recognition motif domain, Zinc finger, CCCH-type, Zinc finger, RING-type [Septoria linicola]|uniref:RNA recognition motif domain, Zinc finger, CCCH-type, Zinc finger, RING-type n=1 Tax=Septoria linicola TaxID=215465 RepID=A0A9Q9ALC3_9PEZI|nr:Putative RNA recognition motif domain, Zinc finger, CCCH-type, Zinc finger, RING-type [Septoria linicola]